MKQIILRSCLLLSCGTYRLFLTLMWLFLMTFNQSWASYEPPKATVKRLLLQESHKETVTTDKKLFSPQMLEGSAVRPRYRTTSSTFSYLSENKGGP